MIQGYENKALKRHFINIKTTVDMHGVKAGVPARIETDKAGTPLKKEWRRRLAESQNKRLVEKSGAAVEIVEKSTPAIEKPKTKKEIK